MKNYNKKMKEIQKKENSTELQRSIVEAEVYNNRECD